MPDVADAEPDKPQAANLELTVLMPCLNEAETVTACVRKAVGFLADNSIDGEVVVADNGSTDGSQWLAADAGARVVAVAEPGYGSALLGGIMAARGQYVIMGDADDSYDFSALTPFVSRLRAGADLVMGNRFTGGIKPGAMPALHRYLGNPVLSFIGRLFFRIKVGDFHCGLGLIPQPWPPSWVLRRPPCARTSSPYLPSSACTRGWRRRRWRFDTSCSAPSEPDRPRRSGKAARQPRVLAGLASTAVGSGPRLDHFTKPR